LGWKRFDFVDLMSRGSLVSASYISRVNAALTDLRSLLQKG
jgi:hypothetical protein